MICVLPFLRHFTPKLALTATVGARLLVGLALTGAPSHAADAYPSRPVTLVIPVAPGGTTDIAGRALAQGLKDAVKPLWSKTGRGAVATSGWPTWPVPNRTATLCC